MPQTNISGTDNAVLQSTISAYADEAYTTARKLSSTEIVGADAQIDPNTETFVGQVRWNKPLDFNINTASLTDSANGTTTSGTQQFYNYVKTVRTFGSSQVNMKKVVTQADGLAKIGRDAGEARATDEHNSILEILKGVAISEALQGAGQASGQAGLGGQTFENDPTSLRHGFYVDLGVDKPVVSASATAQGAARAQGFLNAFGMAFKDYEPEYAYLVVSPEVMASLRSANLVESAGVVDGNITFNTIFGGKFRMLQTRASQGMSTAELTKINTGSGVDIVGAKTSFIVLPYALTLKPLDIAEAVEIERNASSFKGGGTTTLWNRWGYVAHPSGYNWVGSQDAFPVQGDYKKVVTSGTAGALTAATDGLANVTGTWQRKATSALTLGILPIFHS
jgi:hypothetical protein